MSERRQARMRFSIEVLAQILRGQVQEIVATDAPKDLKVVFVDQSKEDMLRGVFTVAVESESFALVPEGGLLPLVTFWYKHYLPEDWQP